MTARPPLFLVYSSDRMYRCHAVPGPTAPDPRSTDPVFGFISTL